MESNSLLSPTENIDSGYFIPPMPNALIDINNILKKPEPNISNLASVISSDLGLSAIMLKTINSAHYGMRRQITDIPQSVMMLGLDFVRTISTYHFLQLAISKETHLALDGFWDTSFQTAHLTGTLIERLKFKRKIPFEDAYSAGLFLNCGTPIMAFKFEDYHEALVNEGTLEDGAFTEIEDTKYQSNHATVGYFVTKSWGLPDVICEMVRSHHDLEFLEDSNASLQHLDLHGLLRIAEHLVYKFKRGNYRADWGVSHESILDHFSLSELDFEEIAQDLAEDFHMNFG